ncbi:MAG: 3-hydroxyacyl-CoA dehydrogenase NAD-binding domain-containing protein [Kiloniellales bacterium]
MDTAVQNESTFVRYQQRDDIGLIVIDNPPVNALGHGVRAGLMAALNEAVANAEVKAVVLTAAGRTFPAGADIREFGKPAQPPSLSEVIAAVETSGKLTVAALHGTAFGGGLELALGCDYRFAAVEAKLGLPEVKLGLLPGAGGTQRLPRLIGVAATLPIIVDGNPVSATKAKALGLVDALAEPGSSSESFIDAALVYARSLLAEGAVKRPLGERAVPQPDADLFETFEAQTRQRKRGFEAPLACIQSVRNAVSLPFAEGLKQERALFETLRDSAQSRAQRHAFFAEREVAKVPGLAKDTPASPVAEAAVIGAGTMGGGIAMVFANAGIPVRLLDAQEEALERGLGIIRRNYEATAKKGRLTAAEVEERMALIRPTVSYDDLATVDLVIEAVFEDMDLKKKVFAELDRVCKPGAILATNTSTLDVDAIAAATGRPESVLGLHFFSPANVMKLLEVVRGQATSDGVLATAMRLGKRVGKVAVAVGNCYGFVGNRMLHRRQSEAVLLVEEGAAPEQVDKVLTDFGFPMGPFAMSDLAGIDVGWRIRNERRKAGDPEVPEYNWLDAIAERGRYGQKTKAGVYRYEEGSRTPIPDPEVAEIIAEHVRDKGVAQRSIEDREILERCLYAMVNEGARILEEGIAVRALEIDVIWIYGYGFPVYRGGPMFWADEIGVEAVSAACSAFQAASRRDVWQPAPLLARFAESGGRFGDL